MTEMKRRDFLKNVTVGSLLLHLPPRIQAQVKSFPDLALIQGNSSSEITKQAIASLGGMQRFVSRGDVVIIKPNIGWTSRPEQAACTNPDVVKALVELCKQANAKEVIVLDNTINPARRTYALSGIAKAAKEAGAKVPYPNPHHVKKTAINGEWLKEWEVYTDFMEADKIINVPVAKTHSLSRLTMGMKNWLGAVGGPRNQLHQALDFVMIDLAKFFKPALTVLDAYRIMVRNGPRGGRLSDVKLHKTVAAGVDYVAVDAVGATFFGIQPGELRYLELASQKGLGHIDLENLKIEKRTV
jgi:uncharacterized protein (DUF362 family)